MREVAPALKLNNNLLAPWLMRFLQDNIRGRGFQRMVVGMSGGVDSSLVAHLGAGALGPGNVIGVIMPSDTSSPASLEDAQLVARGLGIETVTASVSPALAGYEKMVTGVTPRRRGNLMSRLRTMTLFDVSEEMHALPVGTSNKSERMLGYFTWHGDDALPLNPIADLYKTQVWDLAEHMGVPERVVRKPASADLIEGQTDEGDFGFTYAQADLVLHHLLAGYAVDQMVEMGLERELINAVRTLVDRTHWKRHLPAVAMVSDTAINEFYLRPLDF